MSLEGWYGDFSNRGAVAVSTTLIVGAIQVPRAPLFSAISDGICLPRTWRGARRAGEGEGAGESAGAGAGECGRKVVAGLPCCQCGGRTDVAGEMGEMTLKAGDGTHSSPLPWWEAGVASLPKFWASADR